MWSSGCSKRSVLSRSVAVTRQSLSTRRAISRCVCFVWSIEYRTGIKLRPLLAHWASTPFCRLINFCKSSFSVVISWVFADSKPALRLYSSAHSVHTIFILSSPIKGSSCSAIATTLSLASLYMSRRACVAAKFFLWGGDLNEGASNFAFFFGRQPASAPLLAFKPAREAGARGMSDSLIPL